MTQLEFDLGLTTEWHPVMSADRCRDCGWSIATRPWTRASSGITAQGPFALCDDCAHLDGSREVDGLWVSRWGREHTDNDHTRLFSEQATRRARQPVERAA